MYFIISYTLFYILNTQFRQKLLIADSAIVAKDGLFWPNIMMSPQLICDVTRTWGTGIVMLDSSIVLARTNWRKCDVHWWITTVDIDFSPSGIHGIRGLACKKRISFVISKWDRTWTSKVLGLYVISCYIVPRYIESLYYWLDFDDAIWESARSKPTLLKTINSDSFPLLTDLPITNISNYFIDCNE